MEESKASAAQDKDAPPDAATAAEEGAPAPTEAPSTQEAAASGEAAPGEGGGEAGGPKPESQLRTRVKMLHRVLAAIYGTEHVKVSLVVSRSQHSPCPSFRDAKCLGFLWGVAGGHDNL